MTRPRGAVPGHGCPALAPPHPGTAPPPLPPQSLLRAGRRLPLRQRLSPSSHRPRAGEDRGPSARAAEERAGSFLGLGAGREGNEIGFRRGPEGGTQGGGGKVVPAKPGEVHASSPSASAAPEMRWSLDILAVWGHSSRAGPPGSWGAGSRGPDIPLQLFPASS